jgi:hypothetical protein
MPGTPRGKNGWYLREQRVAHFVKLESGKWKQTFRWIDSAKWWEGVALKHMAARSRSSFMSVVSSELELELTDLTDEFDDGPIRVTPTIPVRPIAFKAEKQKFKQRALEMDTDEALPGAVR